MKYFFKRINKKYENRIYVKIYKNIFNIISINKLVVIDVIYKWNFRDILTRNSFSIYNLGNYFICDKDNQIYIPMSTLSIDKSLN